MAQTKKPVTLDYVRSRKKPTIKSCRIALDPEIGEEFDNAKTARDRLRLRVQQRPNDEEVAKELSDAEARYANAEQTLFKNSQKFVFKSIGRKKLDELIEAHPPTPDQIKKFSEAGRKQEELQWNPDTFMPALVAASSMEPVFTEEEANELWNDDSWSPGELAVLFATAFEANMRNAVVNLGND